MTLTEALTTLRPALADAFGTVEFRYVRGSRSKVLQATPGRRVEWPYDGSAESPAGRVFYLPNPVLLAGRAVRPREGDLGYAGERRFELVPFDGLHPATLVDYDPAARGTTGTWRGHWLDVTDRPRRDTLIDLEIPDPDAARSAGGTKDRNAYVLADEGDDVAVTVKAESGGEETRGGKNQMGRTFRVSLAARTVPGSARLAVKSGWLEEQRAADVAAGRSTATRLYLYVESVARDSADALETVLLCRLAGG